MAKTTKVKTDIASIVDEKNSTVETTDTPAVDNVDVKPDTDTKPDADNVEVNPDADEVQDNSITDNSDDSAHNDKPKKFGEKDKVIIKCSAYAGKSIILPTRTVELDENGKCEVTGIEANRLLTIPGYELAK